MKELIPVNETERTCLAIDLYRFLDSSRQFADWTKQYILDGNWGFVEGIDYTSFSQNCEKPQGGRPTKDYVLTLNCAKEIAMLQRSEKGKLARKYFLEIEEAYFNLLKEKSVEHLTVEDVKELKEALANKREKQNPDWQARLTIAEWLEYQADQLSKNEKIYDLYKEVGINPRTAQKYRKVAREVKGREVKVIAPGHYEVQTTDDGTLVLIPIEK